QWYVAHRHLHSFPTRRSSDLAAMCRLFAWLVDLPFDLREVTMCYPKLISEEAVSFLVPFPVTWNAAKTAFHFDAGLHRNGRQFRSEEHTSELQSRENLVCRLL